MLQRDVLLRQRVTAIWGDGEQRGFDAVIQKQGDKLTVLGLSDTGSMGFAIVLQDGTVELTNKLPNEFPFPPRYVLLDVQRTFYPWLPDSNGARADGTHENVVDGERVVETWSAGRLLERQFNRLDASPPGQLTVRYTYDQPDWSAPSFAVLDNSWFGYRLEIDTHAETFLETEDGSQ